MLEWTETREKVEGTLRWTLTHTPRHGSSIQEFENGACVGSVWYSNRQEAEDDFSQLHA